MTSKTARPVDRCQRSQGRLCQRGRGKAAPQPVKALQEIPPFLPAFARAKDLLIRYQYEAKLSRSERWSNAGQRGKPGLFNGLQGWYPHPELNRNQRFRKPPLYPFELWGPKNEGA